MFLMMPERLASALAGSALGVVITKVFGLSGIEARLKNVEDGLDRVEGKVDNVLDKFIERGIDSRGM